MSGFEVCVTVLGLFVAGVLKGATGIGYSTCALPFLAVAVGPGKAMALVVVPAIVSNLSLMLSGGGTVRALTRFWRFYIAIIPGTAVGVGFLFAIDAPAAGRLLGLLTLLYVLLAITRPQLSLGPAAEHRLALPAGFANGILSGLTGSQVLPLVPYMMALRLPPDEQVPAVNVAVALASAALAVSLIASGVTSWSTLALSAAGALPAVLGVATGTRLRNRLGETRFRSLSLGVLALTALGLLLGGDRPLPSCPAQAAEAPRPFPRCLGPQGSPATNS